MKRREGEDEEGERTQFQQRGKEERLQ